MSTALHPKLDRRGVALPAALGALTALAVLLAGLLVIVDVNSKTGTNRRSAVRAVLVAEAGASHAMALLRGSLAGTSYTGLLRGPDGVAGTADDGKLRGFGLATGDQIPDTGMVTTSGGRYTVTVIDDPGDPNGAAATDGNNRVMVSCQGTMPDGGAAEVRVVVGSTPFPGIVTDGTLQISGNPQVYGACGSVHANDDVVISGNPNISGTVSASDTVKGTYADSSGAVKKKKGLSNQPPIEIPSLEAADYCDQADFVLEADGEFIQQGTPKVEFDADGKEVKGWKYTGSGKWDVSGNSMSAGTYCVTGNVKISGNPTGPGNTALPLTILATGTVEFSGNPTIKPDHPDGIAVISGGDLQLSGNPSSTGLDGLFYARSQCQLNGNPSLYGQVICDNEKNAAGTENVVSENKINGNPMVVYNCGGMFGGNRRVLSWFQRLGT